MAELTPMKQQYNEIKSHYEDCLLFFRLGDFYEMFDDDAKLAARELDLALTTRDRGKAPEDQTPMCGVPYHSAEAYIGRLIAKGYKIAICEQTEDPALAKGLVTREVVRVISPGTVTDESMLEDKRANFIAAVYLIPGAGAVCYADVSTGEFAVTGFTKDAVTHMLSELGRIAPREVVLSPGAAANPELTGFLSRRLGVLLEHGGDKFEYLAASARLCRQFGTQRVEELGLEGEDAAVCAAGALLTYLEEAQKLDLSHLSRIELLGGSRYMELDYTTLRGLELTQNLRSGEKKGSLLGVLDRTQTPMGGRLLRSWVERPLLSPAAIRRRLSAVAEIVRDTVIRGELMKLLHGIGDMRRLLSRCVYKTASGRDLKAIGDYCAALPSLTAQLGEMECNMLRAIASMDTLDDIAALIHEAISDEPPFSVREGGILRAGYSEEVDRLRDVKKNGSRLVVELEARERERTGVKKLKVGYNKVFGYYIDIPKSAGDVEIPPEYIRKQTLVSNERYFTPELKELEETLLSSGDRLDALEYELFSAVRDRVAEQCARIQAAADRVAELDCICSLADAAVRNDYCMPEIDVGCTLHISEGRHPVVEAAQPDTPFVPNDVYLNGSTDTLAIVTGPNMAGKSTYMRQTALITLMAQIGSFVPARRAEIGIADRVFTRIGASDDLASGQSTFMVEMSEMAEILKYATNRSLLILDEIGRGTSTYDGMAIARAVLEYCADKKRLGARTMFATHYHELTALEGSLPGVVNYNITAEKRGGKLIFLRRIVRGAADDSYGIEVARLAGVPEEIVARAGSYLKELESAGAALSVAPAADPEPDQLALADLGADAVRDRLQKLDINAMTPIQAMNALAELKALVEV